MNEDPPGVQVGRQSPYKNIKELADAIKGGRPAQFKASGTGQGGIWHLALVGWLQAMGLHSRPCAVGALERRGAGHAGSRRRRRRHRHLLGARGASDDRCRQGAHPRRHGAAAQRRVPGRADAEGGAGHQLLGRRLARHRGPEGPAGRDPGKLTAALKKAYDSKEFKDFMTTRGFGIGLGRAAQLRHLHGRGRQGHGRRDEGGRPGQGLSPMAAAGALASAGAEQRPGYIHAYQRRRVAACC